MFYQLSESTADWTFLLHFLCWCSIKGTAAAAGVPVPIVIPSSEALSGSSVRSYKDHNRTDFLSHQADNCIHCLPGRKENPDDVPRRRSLSNMVPKRQEAGQTFQFLNVNTPKMRNMIVHKSQSRSPSPVRSLSVWDLSLSPHLFHDLLLISSSHFSVRGAEQINESQIYMWKIHGTLPKRKLLYLKLWKYFLKSRNCTRFLALWLDLTKTWADARWQKDKFHNPPIPIEVPGLLPFTVKHHDAKELI